ncbi:MAG: WYL domain-containing protein [Phycisphaeraceae bacterium]
MSADYSKVHRLLRLLMLMQQGRAGSAANLASALGVTERTVYRDLAVLTDLGIPHYLDEETGGYRIRRDYFLPPLHLSASEALAILALAEGVGRTEQIALTGPAATAIERIRTQLPARVIDELGDIDRHIDIQLPASGPAGEAIQDVFTQVRHAIQSRRALRCQYESLNTETDIGEFVFRPYILSFDQRAWYVIGHHAARNAVRRLKLNRFIAIAPTSKPYAIPDDFSLHAYRGNAWRMIRGDRTFNVAIHFNAIVAETVADTNWHSTQQIENHADGSITFRCEVDGLDEIVWWVLGYGPNARVQEPVELVDRIAELTAAAADLYVPPLENSADRH